MLRREQLEDAAKCDAKSACENGLIDGCVKGGCVTYYAQTALELADMLKRLDRENDVCPICGLDKAYGHEKGCELAVLLEGLEG